MKAIWQYGKQWFRNDFSIASHVALGIFLTLIIIANYTFNFEHRYLNVHIGQPVAYLYFFLFYASIYYLVAIIQSLLAGSKRWQDKHFWLKSAFFLAVLAFNAGSAFHYRWLYGFDTINPAVRHWLFYVMSNAGSFFLFAIPLALAWLIWDRRAGDGWYGLQRKGLHLTPYLLLLLGMVPLILAAATQADFLSTYPIYKSSMASGEATGLGVWGNTLLFQLAYALDFVTVELLFRGALIIGLSRVMGKEALLPMVAVYCALHFGKPLGEAVSSIFGGYILGIIALYGRNIWGGAMIHIGVALGMEWAAIWQG